MRPAGPRGAPEGDEDGAGRESGSKGGAGYGGAPEDGVRADVDATRYAPLPRDAPEPDQAGPYRRAGYPQGYGPKDVTRPEGMQGRRGGGDMPKRDLGSPDAGSRGSTREAPQGRPRKAEQS